jgi:uncharacterized protein
MTGSNKHRVLFGSNHPFWSASECIAGLEKLGLGEKAKPLFLSDNAKQVFRIG